MGVIKKHQAVSSKETLVENVIRMIFSGVLARGDHMPSIRNISERYHLSRNTVLVAYKELESLGFIEGRERSCYVVLGELKREQDARAHSDEKTHSHDPTEIPESAQDILAIAKKLESDSNANLSHHFIRKWFTHFSANKNSPQRQMDKVKIDRELKKNLTRYIKIVRGSKVTPDNMVILAGQQEALTIIAHYGKRLKKRPSIIMGEPASPQVLQLFSTLGYEIIQVRVEEEGLDVASFPDCQVDFIYTTPSNNFPTGAKMSALNRKRLLAWSLQHNSLIIENDACFMLGFGQEILPALSETYPVANIIYLYNLNELIGNSVSISILMPPPALKEAFHQLKSLLTSENQPLARQMIGSILGSSHLMKYLANTLRIRQVRYELAVTGLRQVCRQVDIWGLMHSGYFSFAVEDGILPDTLKETIFLPLTLFCQKQEPTPGPGRYLYPIGSLSITDINNINQQLLAHNAPKAGKLPIREGNALCEQGPEFTISTPPEACPPAESPSASGMLLKSGPASRQTSAHRIRTGIKSAPEARTRAGKAQ